MGNHGRRPEVVAGSVAGLSKDTNLSIQVGMADPSGALKTWLLRSTQFGSCHATHADSTLAL